MGNTTSTTPIIIYHNHQPLTKSQEELGADLLWAAISAIGLPLKMFYDTITPNFCIINNKTTETINVEIQYESSNGLERKTLSEEKILLPEEYSTEYISGPALKRWTRKNPTLIIKKESITTTINLNKGETENHYIAYIKLKPDGIYYVNYFAKDVIIKGYVQDPTQEEIDRARHDAHLLRTNLGAYIDMIRERNKNANL
jgi:hypothetical protein